MDSTCTWAIDADAVMAIILTGLPLPVPAFCHSKQEEVKENPRRGKKLANSVLCLLGGGGGGGGGLLLPTYLSNTRMASRSSWCFCCHASTTTPSRSNAIQSFWLLGLLNNSPWVLMLAVATNISSGGVALVVRTHSSRHV